MTKSTFDESNEKQTTSKAAFPTFRAIPLGLLRAARCVWRGWKKSWHYLLAIIVIIVIAYTTLDIYATAQFNHQLNLIRKNGEPTTIAEIIPPKVPDSKIAAILYNRAAAVLTSNRINTGNMGLDFADIPTELAKKNAATFLTKNAKAVDLIRQATNKPDCRFDVDWQHQVVALNPELGRMRNLSDLLSLQAIYEAETGKNSAALEDVRRMFVMAQQMSGETFLIGALTQRYMEAIANKALAKVLLSSSLNKAQALKFQASLPVIDWGAILHHALLVERISTINYPNMFPGLKPFTRLDAAYGLNYWQGIIANASNTPVPVPDDYGQSLKMQMQHSPWYAWMTKNVLPVFVNTRTSFDRAEVQRRQREIALALAVYHTQYHQYPTTLAPAEKLWKSTFLLDPYSNKPFLYKSDGKTFLLYSVGLNGKDDGGKWKGGRLKSDIVWGH